MFEIICNNYTREISVNFANPKSPSMLGIMQLHDHIMFFITLVLILKLIYFMQCVYTALKMEQDVDFIPLKWKRSFNRYQIKVYKAMKVNIYEHNPWLEFIWTLLPAIVLLVMALPSLYLLYSLESSPKPLYTIMIIGNQWYWTYQYADFDVQATFVEVIKEQIQLNSNRILNKNINHYYYYERNMTVNAFNFAKKKLPRCLSVDSLPIADGDLPRAHPRLLSADQPLFLPANTEVRLLITSSDVIHSWAVPSLGIKMDAIPGRLNQVIFKTPFSGTSWGQCSEICGVNHVIMPIEVRVVSLQDFEYILKTYLKDYLKAPVKEFMGIIDSTYKILWNTRLSNNFSFEQYHHYNQSKLLWTSERIYFYMRWYFSKSFCHSKIYSETNLIKLFETYNREKSKSPTISKYFAKYPEYNI